MYCYYHHKVVTNFATTIMLFLAASLFVGTSETVMISSSADNSLMPCLVDACTSQYKQSLDDVGGPSHGDSPSSASVEHCLLLQSYRQCLNDTFGHCLAQLDFHSATTAAARRWHKFGCDQLLLLISHTAVQHYQQHVGGGDHIAAAAAQFIKCAVPNLANDADSEEETAENEDYYSDDAEDHNIDQHESVEGNDGTTQRDGKSSSTCAMFGQLNLLPFHASSSLTQIDQCSFVGARPLVDNPFFLIQITAHNLLVDNSSSSSKNDFDHAAGVKAQLIAITNIAIIIRPKRGCVNDRKLYLADASYDPRNNALPATFVDGTSNGGALVFGKKAVEIVRTLTNERVVINLRYINTEILIHNIGNCFFNIFVRIPTTVQNHFGPSLCAQSCHHHMSAKMPENVGAFSNNNKNEIAELCSKLIDRLAANENDARGDSRHRHSWISAICARDLTHASITTTSTVNADFPTMAPWLLKSLFFAAEELHAAVANEQSNNDSNSVRPSSSSSNSEENDKKSPFEQFVHLADKNSLTISDGTNANAAFEWHTVGKHQYSAASVAIPIKSFMRAVVVTCFTVLITAIYFSHFDCLLLLMYIL